MKQPQLEGMPPENKWEGTPLGDTMEEYASKKEKLAKIKLEMTETEKILLSEMKKERVKILKCTVDGENFEFERIDGTDHIRCAKITKQPQKKKKVFSQNSDFE